MMGFTKWNEDAKSTPDDRYIAAADGIRALAIFMVAWFHVWQQSWLYPGFFVFGKEFSFDPLVRSGYMYVDVMIFLSGFCLYLPYTRMQKDTKLPSALEFYKKRFARLGPSYYLTILIMLIVALATDAYHENMDHLRRDLISHLTFTHMFNMETYYFTNMNAALWTIALEVQLYLIFPLLVRVMRKHPIIPTLVAIIGCTWYREYLLSSDMELLMYFNQFPAYADLFCIGMLTAWIFGKVRKWPHNGLTRILCSAGTFLAVYFFIRLSKDQSTMGSMGYLQQGQLLHRLPMAACSALLILCTSNAGWLTRHLFGNPVTHFLSGISYHVYIWNQVMAVWILNARLVPSQYENPNYSGDLIWQERFTLVCVVCILLTATILTYGFERPVARLILGNRKHKDTKLQKQAKTEGMSSPLPEQDITSTGTSIPEEKEEISLSDRASQ